MPTPAAIAAARLGRAKKIAELQSAAKKAAFAQMAPSPPAVAVAAQQPQVTAADIDKVVASLPDTSAFLADPPPKKTPKKKSASHLLLTAADTAVINKALSDGILESGPDGKLIDPDTGKAFSDKTLKSKTYELHEWYSQVEDDPAGDLHVDESGKFALAPLEGGPVGDAPAMESSKPLKKQKQPKKSKKPFDYAPEEPPPKWTPEFSKKVWDYWSVTDPDFWMAKNEAAAKELHALGELDFEYDPTFGEVVPHINGYVADAGQIESLAAKHLPPEFFHTEKGLPDPSWTYRDAVRLKTAPSDYERPKGMGIREYVAKLRELSGQAIHKRGVAKAVSDLESGFADDIKSGVITGFLPEDSGPAAALHNARNRDYLDYLAANGVDQRTLDAIASGDLQMDPASRAARAQALDLDPAATWYRWDSPFKTELKGFTGAALSKVEKRRHDKGKLGFVDFLPKKEGLVYTSHNPAYAKLGVQVPRDEIVLYPLLGPSGGIAGLDELPQSAHDAFRDKQNAALNRKYPGDGDDAMERRRRQRREHLGEPLGEEFGPDARPAALDRLSRVHPDSDVSGKTYETLPHYITAESRKTYLEPLMASGAKGTLVKDETGLSTAFTPSGARALRRADIAPLDVRFRNSRNILQSLLAPAAIAAGASQQQPGILSGLTEER